MFTCLLLHYNFINQTLFSEKENANDSGEVQCNGPLLENRLPNESEEKSVKSGQPRSALRTPLKQRDNLPAGNQIKNDFQVQQLDTLSMMDQLAQELGEMMLS